MTDEPMGTLAATGASVSASAAAARADRQPEPEPAPSSGLAGRAIRRVARPFVSVIARKVAYEMHTEVDARVSSQLRNAEELRRVAVQFELQKAEIASLSARIAELSEQIAAMEHNGSDNTRK